MDKFRKQEIRLYIIIWAAVFAIVPLVLLYNVIAGKDQSVVFDDILQTWLRFLPFLILFVVHDVLLAQLLKKKKYSFYTVSILAVLIIFGIFCFSGTMRPPVDGPMPGGPVPGAPMGRPADGLRPITPEVMQFALGVLIIVANLGIKSFFLGRSREYNILALKAENTAMQLAALRYQINPHFFMNTLNNIHALVDLDAEKAKESIEEFSKLMRIVLYDGNTPTIPLQTEMDYLRHYVSLMRLRFPDEVDINLDLPEADGGAVVPPLIMASCIENAFKHGVSYDGHSFIRASVVIEKDKVVFTCANSRHKEREEDHRGMGLVNVKKRLDLLYGQDYTLSVNEKPDFYGLTMVIPKTVERVV